MLPSGAELGPILSGSVVSLLVMTEIQLLRPEGFFASPAFSHVAVVPPDATTVYVGGQNAVDHNGELVGGTDVAAQTRQVMANLATALEAAGAGIEHLVNVLVMLVEGVDVQAAYAAAAATLSSAKAPPLVTAAIVRADRHGVVDRAGRPRGNRILRPAPEEDAHRLNTD